MQTAAANRPGTVERTTKVDACALAAWRHTVHSHTRHARACGGAGSTLGSTTTAEAMVQARDHGITRCGARACAGPCAACSAWCGIQSLVLRWRHPHEFAALGPGVGHLHRDPLRGAARRSMVDDDKEPRVAEVGRGVGAEGSGARGSRRTRCSSSWVGSSSRWAGCPGGCCPAAAAVST